ncbi:hypothetical protein [Vulgatibacter sp.]|uniref:hypothetical protein n=1 Tax=Vulgatibacter sp. TaxID=1971226 RepID=UPI00356532FF
MNETPTPAGPPQPWRPPARDRAMGETAPSKSVPLAFRIPLVINSGGRPDFILTYGVLPTMLIGAFLFAFGGMNLNLGSFFNGQLPKLDAAGVGLVITTATTYVFRRRDAAKGGAA